jgi:hypothetical protein
VRDGIAIFKVGDTDPAAILLRRYSEPSGGFDQFNEIGEAGLIASRTAHVAEFRASSHRNLAIEQEWQMF